MSERKLIVSVVSFSYKSGIPQDASGHGGGFVFDCRCLPNPGRLEEFKKLTGLDKQTIKFLEEQKAAGSFADLTYALVEMTVQSYLERKLDSLFVAYGCTGGQHRSVYMAELLNKRLKKNFPVKVSLSHLGLKAMGLL